MPKGASINHCLLVKLLIIVYFLLQGKLKCKETVTNGFDNMFDAFVGLFKGDNTGKAVVKA